MVINLGYVDDTEEWITTRTSDKQTVGVQDMVPKQNRDRRGHSKEA